LQDSAREESHNLGRRGVPLDVAKPPVRFDERGWEWSNDIKARLIAQWLSERLGQQFVVDNRPGASANIAMESVVNRRPTVTRWVMVATSSAANATLFENLTVTATSRLSEASAAPYPPE